MNDDDKESVCEDKKKEMGVKDLCREERLTCRVKKMGKN